MDSSHFLQLRNELAQKEAELSTQPSTLQLPIKYRKKDEELSYQQSRASMRADQLVAEAGQRFRLPIGSEDSSTNSGLELTDPMSARAREALAMAVANLDDSRQSSRSSAGHLDSFLSAVRISNVPSIASSNPSSVPVPVSSGALGHRGLPRPQSGTSASAISARNTLSRGASGFGGEVTNNSSLNSAGLNMGPSSGSVNRNSSGRSSLAGLNLRRDLPDSELDSLVNGILDVPDHDRESGRGSTEQVEDFEDSATEGLGAAAQIRYQKAKLVQLREAQATLLARVAQMEVDSATQQNRVKALQGENQALQRRVVTAEALSEKYKKSSTEAAARVVQLEKEVSSFKREMEKKEKARLTLEQESKQRDAKLNRALLDADRARSKLSQVKDVDREVSSSARNEVTKLQNENKRLLQQKQDLFKAFKCQFKLIENLKKQLVHVEAARLLAFTEEEFAKALQIESVVGSSHD